MSGCLRAVPSISFGRRPFYSVAFGTPHLVNRQRTHRLLATNGAAPLRHMVNNRETSARRDLVVLLSRGRPVRLIQEAACALGRKATSFFCQTYLQLLSSLVLYHSFPRNNTVEA